ncbi:hypothetical protein HMPREF9445_00117 [Bacteroides clarus YIT 12056]|uniref:Uncharacterized protein n=1 Tax=Bacteroides clarus YIT 12056 TaxID=762984 RepID=A0ABP2KW49_9BACE|nr:hypothetical protein HMPREF9445_00117 [Bacteroides clarus YIT 12056]
MQNRYLFLFNTVQYYSNPIYSRLLQKYFHPATNKNTIFTFYILGFFITS